MKTDCEEAKKENWSLARGRRFPRERSDEPPGRIDRSIRDRDRRPIAGPRLRRSPDRRTPRHDPLSFTFTTARCERRLIGVSYFFPSLRYIDVTKTPPRGRLRTFFILFFLIPSNTLKCYLNGFGVPPIFPPITIKNASSTGLDKREEIFKKSARESFSL